MFEIKLEKKIIEQLEKLPINKKILVISKISFLENTGFLGNCKTLGGGIFEFKIKEIENFILYLSINNTNNLINFSFDKNLLKETSENNFENFKDFKNKTLNDLKYLKLYFNTILNMYEINSELTFLENEIENIYNINPEYFKNITGLENFSVSSNIELFQDLLNKIKFSLVISKDNISKKTGVDIKEINEILKIKENFNLKSLNSLLKYFYKNKF